MDPGADAALGELGDAPAKPLDCEVEVRPAVLWDQEQLDVVRRAVRQQAQFEVVDHPPAVTDDDRPHGAAGQAVVPADRLGVIASDVLHEQPVISFDLGLQLILRGDRWHAK